MGEVSSYQTTSGSKITTSTTPPKVTEKDIKGLVAILGQEVSDITNNVIGKVTITNTDSTGKTTTEVVDLSKEVILGQITDLEYRLLLYSNSATTVLEKEFITATQATIDKWKTLFVGTVSTPAAVKNSVKSDPDYNVVLYYLDYVQSVSYIIDQYTWITISGYVKKLNNLFTALKKKYPGDEEITNCENTLNAVIANIKEFSPLLTAA